MATPSTKDIEDELRYRVLCAVESLTKQQTSKDSLRSLHADAVKIELGKHQDWIREHYHKYERFFADGTDIDPLKVQPILVEVIDSWQADLFRLARLTWSLPFNKGYGRRLRFLILDNHNEKLIGILGLQSPPLDFPARDRLFVYPQDRKVELVNQTMDIYTLGAVPPYSRLLAGKLIALAASSDEVREIYRRKYSHRTTEISGNDLPARLVALTTTSAFGRSSIYNRLTYHNRLVARSIGYTEGYGSFHFAPLLPLFREFLENQGISTRGGFGVGPRIMWQTCVRALTRLGLSSELLKHGVKREVFIFELARNLSNFMSGKAGKPIYHHQSFDDLAEWWRERWMLARADRVDGWHDWDRKQIKRLLILENNDHKS